MTVEVNCHVTDAKEPQMPKRRGLDRLICWPPPAPHAHAEAIRDLPADPDARAARKAVTRAPRADGAVIRRPPRSQGPLRQDCETPTKMIRRLRGRYRTEAWRRSEPQAAPLTDHRSGWQCLSRPRQALAQAGWRYRAAAPGPQRSLPPGLGRR